MAKRVINDEFLQQLETLQMLIKNNIGGQFGGNRKSRTFGSPASLRTIVITCPATIL